MRPYIATYDLRSLLPEPYSPFLDAAQRYGWFHWIADDKTGNKYRLPNTTVHGWFTDYNAAADAFDNAANEAARDIGAMIVVEKWIIAERGLAFFGSDTIVQRPAPTPVSSLGLGLGLGGGLLSGLS
jgi:hypothetical protein